MQMTEKPTTTLAEYDVTEQIGHLLRRATQRHTAIFQQHIGDSQLTAIQFVTLCALYDKGPSSQIELVAATAVDQATIRGIINRLKSRGLVLLSTSLDDKRKVIISLSPEGKALIEQTIPRAQHISQLTLGNLNPAEQIAIVYLLKKMSDDNGVVS
ncbi:MAG TPA: MarR family transcriptional regulator [Paenalcaligenes hominis]|uniref:MarR family transcriptional regulator n=2 Tax=Paenalcaligenes hominis TaxID=643674 RepID=A0A9D3ABJ1_9BURK|nr:MarR family transcriptional regulator [Paenalcaligenes hominis]